MTPLELARLYTERGWATTPVGYMKKSPLLKGWQKHVLKLADLPQHFGERQLNVGVLLGEPSGGLTDVDIDCKEAAKLATKFLPATGAVFGRVSNCRSHRLHNTNLKATIHFNDPLASSNGTGKFKARLFELRSTGSQTVFPGSVHESGEPIFWEQKGEPSQVEADLLIIAAKKLAAATLLLRYYPQKGVRQDVALALAGMLQRRGWTEQEASHFIEAVCEAAGDEETLSRVQTVFCTARKLKEGGQVTGFPKLATLIDERLAAKLSELVDLRNGSTGSDAPTEKGEQPLKATDNKRLSQGAKLIALVEGSELFHTSDGKTYATVQVNNHQETVSLNSRSFKEWLAHRFYNVEGTTPSAQAMQDALNVLNAKARFDGVEQEVHIRVAQLADIIYLDLCDAEWRVIEVTSSAWRIIEAHQCPIKFRRTRGMLPLPEPGRNGSMDTLKHLINIAAGEFMLVVMWLVAAFRHGRPFPLLVLLGEQGSAKSTTARILRAIIDPNTAALRSEPRDVRDLMIAANNSWCIAFDNLSAVQTWLSDALCRLATGGGFATRELYANDEEVLFDAMRPVLLTSIEELATRGDLLDRAVIIYLPTIPDEQRRTEADVWSEFEAVHASILGALLDGVSAALRNISHVKLPRLPRMADFAEWATAAEEALGFEPGAFMDTYDDNRRSANTLALEASPIAAVVFTFLAKHSSQWTGTATQLLAALNEFTEENVKRQQSWPKSPKALSSTLRRLAPNLRKIGIDVSFLRESGTGRRLIALDQASDLSSHASQTAGSAN
jgi:hypothetical protein